MYSCGDERTPPLGMSQHPSEAEGSLTEEVLGRAGSSPDNDGTNWYCQTVRVRLARQRGVTRVNQWLNPLKRETDPKSGRYGSGSGAYPSYVLGGTTRAMAIDVSVRGHGEGLRRNHDEAAAEELGTHPVKGNMVNMGTIPGSPSLSHIQCEDGQAHRRLMALGWGGGFVVVRGRESRLQGEGIQRTRSRSTATPGGRR